MSLFLKLSNGEPLYLSDRKTRLALSYYKLPHEDLFQYIKTETQKTHHNLIVTDRPYTRDFPFAEGNPVLSLKQRVVSSQYAGLGAGTNTLRESVLLTFSCYVFEKLDHAEHECQNILLNAIRAVRQFPDQQYILYGSPNLQKDSFATARVDGYILYSVEWPVYYDRPLGLL